MIVDGGLGIELERRGFAYSTPLWSAQALLEQPELLVAIHRANLAAGAQIIETATYQLSHAGLRNAGYDDAAIDDVFAHAVRLAREAIRMHRAQTGASRELLVAASLGPFGATVGDGSEYSGKQHLSREALYAFHAERVASIARAQPDIFLFETIPSRAEVLVIAQVARDVDVHPVWLSLSCTDGLQTYGGDDVGEIAAALEASPNVDVIGINCTAPAAVVSLVTRLKSATTKPIMVCPNLGQHWEPDKHGLAGGTPEADFLRRIPEWLTAGVTHIGGCCGVGPNMVGDIARIVSMFASRDVMNR